MNKISVIVPVYNGEDYIDKCIRLILNQTYKNFELIIINDGSTDKTMDIIKKYKDDRIKVYSQCNKGAGAARNLGLCIAEGEYICFIDCDDIISDNYLQQMIKMCKNYNADIATCAYEKKYKINNKTKILNKSEGLKYLIALPEKIPMSVIGKIFTRDIIANIRFDENNHFEDIEFSTKTFLNANKVVYYCNEILYKHVKRVNSRSKYYEGDDRIKACLSSIDLVKKTCPDLLGDYICYTLYNSVAIANSMILNNKYNLQLLAEIKNIVSENIKYLKKSNYSLPKKMQLYLFNYNFNIYSKVYKTLKRGEKDG